LKRLLFPVVEEHAGVALATVKREGSNQTLWDEIVRVEKARNAVLHNATRAEKAIVKLAIVLAEYMLDEVCTAV
jgi:hypothetical protein